MTSDLHPNVLHPSHERVERSLQSTATGITSEHVQLVWRLHLVPLCTSGLAEFGSGLVRKESFQLTRQVLRACANTTAS